MANFKITSGCTHQEPDQIIEAANITQLIKLVQRHVIKKGGIFSFLIALFSSPKVTAAELEYDNQYIFSREEVVHPLRLSTLYTCGRFLDVIFRGQHFEYIVYRLP